MTRARMQLGVELITLRPVLSRGQIVDCRMLGYAREEHGGHGCNGQVKRYVVPSVGEEWIGDPSDQGSQSREPEAGGEVMQVAGKFFHHGSQLGAAYHST